MTSLKGKIALVTGASRGIGYAAAEALARDGADVIVTARDLDAAERAARTFQGTAVGLRADVTRPGDMEAAVQTATVRFGGLDILVNNAGVIGPIGHIENVAPEDWAANLATNLTGAYAALYAALPALLKRGGGYVINLSSGAAHRAMEGWSAYCASKAGLAMLTRSVDTEYRDRGIISIGFAPGVVDTGMQGEIRAAGINPISRIPRENLAPTAGPGRAIARLCSGVADRYAGMEVDLRDAEFRASLGLD